jgi:hypothetical protein
MCRGVEPVGVGCSGVEGRRSASSNRQSCVRLKLTHARIAALAWQSDGSVGGLRPELRLEYVYGFRCKDCRSNILIASTGEVARKSTHRCLHTRDHECTRDGTHAHLRSSTAFMHAPTHAGAQTQTELFQVVYFAASVAIIADRKTNTQARTARPHAAEARAHAQCRRTIIVRPICPRSPSERRMRRSCNRPPCCTCCSAFSWSTMTTS